VLGTHGTATERHANVGESSSVRRLDNPALVMSAIFIASAYRPLPFPAWKTIPAQRRNQQHQQAAARLL